MIYHEILVLTPSHSLEDFPTELSDAPAESLLNAFTVVWHPHLLADVGALPRWRRADEHLPPEPGRLIVIPQPCDDWVSQDTIDEQRRAGVVVLKGFVKREEYAEGALAPLLEALEAWPVEPELVADFYALGLTWLMTELLSRHMRNISIVDHTRLESEAVAAAKAAVDGDRAGAEAHLRRAFETLLECRERFYPVDCYLLDLCLLAPRQVDASLTRLCNSPAPSNVLITAEDLATVESEQPAVLEALRAAVKDERLGLVGGDWRETGTPLLSLQHLIWNLRRGHAEFQRLLGATPRVWGRRRFGVGPYIPQLVLRAGGSSALHFVIDDGQYPDEEHTKFRWQGCDGSAVDALSRIPLAGDSASSFLRFPQRMAESMDHDHAAGILFARWPELRTPFLDDLRRAHRYAPVLGRFVTLDKFFSGTDIPGRLSDYKAGQYFSPLLVQAVARQQADPISRYVREWTRRHRFEAMKWCSDLAELLTTGRPDASDAPALHEALELADPDAPAERQDEVQNALAAFEGRTIDRIRDVLAPGGAGPAGWLVVNPLSFPRKAVVELPGGAETDSPDTRVVELPPCGFGWIESVRPAPTTAKTRQPTAADFVLRNEFFEVVLSEVTGGIAQVRTYQRSPNRISQQLAFRFPRERTITTGEGEQAETIKTFYSEMQLSESRVVSDSPDVGAIETLGLLLDQQNGSELAEFRQLTRVRRGRPFVEVEIELTPRSMPEGDPWSNYFGVRWAWKHESVAVSRSLHQAAHPVGEEQRFEAPHFIEIADDAFRTTILTHGLPFHRRTGGRMLDTLLIVAGETQRKFRFDIAIDEAYPLQAALDVLSPPIAIPTATRPANRSAWLFHLGTRNVVLLDLRPLDTSEATAPPVAGFVARFLETEGRHRTFTLQCFRNPAGARQRDFQGKTIQDCRVTGDEVQIEIAPYEVCDIEIRF